MKKLLLVLSLILAAAVSCTKEQTGGGGSSDQQFASYTGEATNITSGAATVSGKAKINGGVASDTKFGILYSLSSDILYGSANVVEAIAEDFDSDYNYSVGISGLIGCTTYYFRSYLYHKEKIYYGDVKSFITKATDPTAVELGLSVLWASCNIGASKPEEYGRYFAWGDVVGQTWNGSQWSGGGFSSNPKYEVDTNGNLKPEYDAVHVLLGGGSWRMPTNDEWKELINNCTCIWTSNYNGTGVAGRIFTSKKTGYTDKSIFLPAAGFCKYSTLTSAGSYGYYWSSTFGKGNYAWCLDFYLDGVGTCYGTRGYGLSLRPVTE